MTANTGSASNPTSASEQRLRSATASVPIVTSGSSNPIWTGSARNKIKTEEPQEADFQPRIARMKIMSNKVTILLVDDRRENLALEAILKTLDENLVRATSGREALKYLLKNDVAVILLDVEMPGMDGFKTATLIREREKTRHTPIIFLTASGNSDVHVNQGYFLGVVDYIFKPISADVLKSKVSTFVEMFKQRQEVQRQSALLTAERDFISAVLDTVDSFVLVLDSEGRILHVNRAWEE